MDTWTIYFKAAESICFITRHLTIIYQKALLYICSKKAVITKTSPFFQMRLEPPKSPMLPETLKALGLPMLEIAKQDSTQIFSLCSESYFMNSLSAVPLEKNYEYPLANITAHYYDGMSHITYILNK